MKERIWKAITAKIVNNPERVERIIKKGGLKILGAHLVIPKIGEPISTHEDVRVIVIRGTVVMQNAYGMMDWAMTGDTFINDADSKVCGLEEGLAAVLVI